MSERYKYPRTLHCPWSPGSTSDDRFVESMEPWVGKEVVLTEKMDGENTSIYKNFFHARSMSGNMHPSRNRVKSLTQRLSHDLNSDIRLCGENCYAKHSIQYTSLPSYFLVFSVWNESICYSWDETVEWCKLLDLNHVPVLYRGIYDEDLIRSFYIENRQPDPMEGYVIRLASSFEYQNFATSVVKFVRVNHVQTDEHWLSKPIVPNTLSQDRSYE